jgi:hypothetical protein
MLNKCACGSYTNYGVVCAMCAISNVQTVDELELDLDELVEEELDSSAANSNNISKET